MSALSSPDGSAENVAWAENMAWALAICFSIVSMLSAGWLMGRNAALSVRENEIAFRAALDVSSHDQQKCLAARTSEGSACARLTTDDLVTLLRRAAGVTVSMIPLISSAATFAICFTMVGILLVVGWLRGASAAHNSHRRGTAWRREGSEYIGREVVCAVTYTDGRVGEAWGIITGWLSADQSDFTNDQVSLFLSLYLSFTLSLSPPPRSVSPVSPLSLYDFTNDQGNAAALWHVVFDDNFEKDLEEHEVEEAALAAGSKKHEPAGDTGVGRTALSVQGKEMMMGRLLQAIKFKPTDFSAVLDPRRSSQDQDKDSKARANAEGSGSSNGAAVATKKRRKPRKKTGAVTSADAAALAYILYPSCQNHSVFHVCRDSD